MGTSNCLNVLENVSWTINERQLMDFRNIQCDKEIHQLHDIISYRMRESTLGIFLYHLNKVQEKCITIQQDKLDRVMFDIDKKMMDLKVLERRNDICENVFTLIQDLLVNNPSGIITAKNTLQQLKVLRLTGSKVAIMDDSLRSLFQLQALVLAGNCLSQVPGHCLPRSLLLLELYCNRLQDLSHLLEDCPPHLLYLGLARNNITQVDTRISHLVENLYHLDLAQNDIEELPIVISACSELANLSSLLLIGNPCSMTEQYLHYIICNMPKLIFLDGILIKESCKESCLLNGDHLTGTLQISLFRIMSLPKPTPEKINKKKVLHSFRIEISCPLLKSYVPVRDEFFIEGGNENNNERIHKEEGSKPKTKGKDKDGYISTIDSSRGGKSKEVKKGKGRSRKKSAAAVVEDSKENKEYEAMLKTDKPESLSMFVSDRKTWGEIVEFADPTIEVTNCDLFTLRNVFRSNLTIRLVLFKTFPPNAKKGKKNKHSKNKKKERNVLEENDEHVEKETKEVLVSKTTIAKLVLPLQDIQWNTSSLDFIWSKTNPLKTEIALGLKELQYVKKRKSKNKRGKAGENTPELQIPSELTIHIGVGVKRLPHSKKNANNNEDLR